MTRKQVQRRIQDDLKNKAVTLSKLAKKMNIGYGTLHRFVHKGTVGTVRVWEKIHSHYA